MALNPERTSGTNRASWPELQCFVDGQFASSSLPFHPFVFLSALLRFDFPRFLFTSSLFRLLFLVYKPPHCTPSPLWPKSVALRATTSATRTPLAGLGGMMPQTIQARWTRSASKRAKSKTGWTQWPTRSNRMPLTYTHWSELAKLTSYPSDSATCPRSAVS